MKERPILFNGEMVRALLDGRKTQTRRLVDMRVPMGYIGPKGSDNDPDCWGWQAEDGMWYVLGRGHNDRCHYGNVSIPCPHGAVGDRLWVRETWGDADHYYQGHANDCPSVVAYAADRFAIQFDAEEPTPVPSMDIAQWNWDKMKWRPSIHMPRWASRIDLEITEVRVQRANSITDADAIAEGARCCVCDGPVDGTSENDCGCFHSRRMATHSFALLWDSINGERASWSSNPWTWAITFKRVRP